MTTLHSPVMKPVANITPPNFDRNPPRLVFGKQLSRRYKLHYCDAHDAKPMNSR
jgi:hypothetical protein